MVGRGRRKSMLSGNVMGKCAVVGGMGGDQWRWLLLDDKESRIILSLKYEEIKGIIFFLRWIIRLIMTTHINKARMGDHIKINCWFKKYPLVNGRSTKKR